MLLVCAAVGIPYLHHVFSRADYSHLAVSVMPFLIGFALWGMEWSVFKIAPLLFLTSLTFFSVAYRSDIYKCLQSDIYFPIKFSIQGETISLDPITARILICSKMAAGNLKWDESFLAFPRLASLYPFLGLKSPTWEVYSALPSTEKEQLRMIDDVEKNNVCWGMIDNSGIDGRDDLRLQNAQPLFWNYLKKHYLFFQEPNLPKGYYVIKKNDNSSLGINSRFP